MWRYRYSRASDISTFIKQNMSVGESVRRTGLALCNPCNGHTKTNPVSLAGTLLLTPIWDSYVSIGLANISIYCQICQTFEYFEGEEQYIRENWSSKEQ